MPDTQQENAKNLKNLGLKATGPRLKILEIFGIFLLCIWHVLFQPRDLQVRWFLDLILSIIIQA